MRRGILVIYFKNEQKLLGKEQNSLNIIQMHVCKLVLF